MVICVHSNLTCVATPGKVAANPRILGTFFMTALSKRLPELSRKEEWQKCVSVNTVCWCQRGSDSASGSLFLFYKSGNWNLGRKRDFSKIKCEFKDTFWAWIWLLRSGEAPFHFTTLLLPGQLHRKRQRKNAFKYYKVHIIWESKQTVKGKKIPSLCLEGEMKRRQKGEYFYLTFQISFYLYIKCPGNLFRAEITWNLV